MAQTKEELQQLISQLNDRVKDLEVEEDVQIEELLSSLTETGNAERFIRLFGDSARYIHEIHKWAVWDGIRWKIDTTGEVIQLFKRVVADMEKQYAECLSRSRGNDDALKSLKQAQGWIKQSKQKNRIASSLDLAHAEPGITLPYSEFDCKGHFLGVRNGVVDLRNGSLIQGDPKYLMMMSSPVEYDPQAYCPNWLQFLDEIMQGDEGKIDLLQQIAGSALIGNTKEKMFVLQGTGSNGKSTYVAALNQVLGITTSGGYGMVLNPKLILDGNFNPEYYLATLKGARCIVMSETRYGAALNDTLIKQVVDTEEGLQARLPKGEPFHIRIVGTVLLTTNPIPKVVSTDNGTWRRLVLVTFDRVFDTNEKDRQLLRDKLNPELPGILNWCVQGAKRYIEAGEVFDICESVETATREWREGEDKLGTFVREEMVNDGGVTKLTDFVEEYTKWCEPKNYYAGAERTIKRDLEMRGFQFDLAAIGGTARILGWSLISEADEVAKMRNRIRSANTPAERSR